MLQHERDKEGDEFADKEKFMTSAYKKQLEEVRQAEEEEKKREGEHQQSNERYSTPLM
jgi:coiled-coil domain-containing protein 55